MHDIIIGFPRQCSLDDLASLKILICTYERNTSL